MSNKSLYKVGLAAAILSTIGWLAFIAAGNPDYSEISGRELFLAWQGNRFGWLLYGWGGVFGALFSIPYFLSFHYALKNTGSVRSVATTATIIKRLFSMTSKSGILIRNKFTLIKLFSFDNKRHLL